MEYGRKNDRKWNNKPRKKERNAGHTPAPSIFVPQNKEAIRTYKLNMKDCAHCSEPITDLASALIDKASGGAIHFDCVLKKLQEQERLTDRQKIAYIGQGRFAVVVFENPHDLRKFTIIRIIEWEERDKTCEWRDKMAELYSQTK